MTKNEDWGSSVVAIDQYNSARYYDYLLGGFHNFAVDRKAGDLVIKACPDIRLAALANRTFLRKAVKFLCQQGIDQFLDIGSGIPTSGNVHEVAQKINTDAHVVYVDIDPIAVIHSQAILKENPNASVIQEDIHNIEKIFEHPSFTASIDLQKPLGVLMVSILHFVLDEEGLQRIFQELMNRLASGSYIVISHYSSEGAPIETVTQLSRFSAGASSQSISRSLAEISRLFDGFELVAPGVVRVPLWRPESSEDPLFDRPERTLAFAGVGRKP